MASLGRRPVLCDGVAMPTLRSLSALLVAALAAVLVLAAAPGAHAQTWRHTDASRDVVVQPYDETQPLSVEVDRRRGDLTRVTARYDADALQVASAMPDFCGNYWELRVATSRGDTFVVSRGISESEGCFESYVRVRRNSYRFTCEGVTAQRTASGIVARVPRTCLGSPYRVRVGLQLFTGMDVERGYGTSDDALRTGKVTRRQPRLSPWIVGGSDRGLTAADGRRLVTGPAGCPCAVAASEPCRCGAPRRPRPVPRRGRGAAPPRAGRAAGGRRRAGRPDRARRGVDGVLRGAGVRRPLRHAAAHGAASSAPTRCSCRSTSRSTRPRRRR